MALTWNTVQRAYSPNPGEYFARAQASGLQARVRTAQTRLEPKIPVPGSRLSKAETYLGIETGQLEQSQGGRIAAGKAMVLLSSPRPTWSRGRGDWPRIGAHEDR
jgi:hypothetical protein